MNKNQFTDTILLVCLTAVISTLILTGIMRFNESNLRYASAPYNTNVIEK